MPEAFIRDANSILRSKKPLDERLRELCDAVSGFVGGGAVSILLFDRDSEDFFIRASTRTIRPNTSEVYFASEGTLEELALMERRVIILGEQTPPPEGHRQGAVMMVPLISLEEPIGILVLHAVIESGLSQERQVVVSEAAQLLADIVGLSLSEESATLRMTKVAAINEVGVNIISTLDLSRLLTLVATSACLIMEAETCVIRLLDPETGKYGIRECYGMKVEEEQKELFLLDKKAVTRILKGEPSLLVRDLSEETDWNEFSDIAHTLISFPLSGDDGILGTITIFDKLPHKTFFPSPFTAEDLATFSKLVRYVEKAVSNAIAYTRNDRLRNLDESTGLPTLKYFQDRLLNEISRAKRFQRQLVLMICEVSIRVPEEPPSRFGYGEGRVLKRVAKAIRSALREYDVVARISNMKFGMILPEAEDGKASVIPRIKNAVMAEVEQARKKMENVRVDIRFGHASFPEDGDDHEKLIFKSNILKM